MRDLSNDTQTLRGKGQDIVRVGTSFTKPVRLLRSVLVELQTPKTRSDFFRTTLTAEEEIELEKTYEPTRLRKLALAVCKRFDLPKKNVRFHQRRGGYQVFIHVWEGVGTKKDHDKMKAIVRWVSKRARSI